MNRADAAQLRSAAAKKSLYIHHTIRIILFALASLLILASLADNAGAFGHSIDDLTQFNHRPALVIAVPSGDTIRVRPYDGTAVQTVHLLAIAAPHGNEHGAQASRDYTASRLLAQPVTLLLEPPNTRDESGHLLAYVFPFDTDNINVDIVHDGMAYADRRTPALLRSLIDPAEAEARKKHRGLWKDLTESQMPQWRRQWLHDLYSKHTSN